MSSNNILTVQAGTYSNWVGSHYWSSVWRRGNQDARNFFQEESSGEYVPRLFVIDSTEGFGGSILAEARLGVDEMGESSGPIETPSREQKLQIYNVGNDNSESSLHSLRKSILSGSNSCLDSSTVDYGSYQYWSDFWELPKFPQYNLVQKSISQLGRTWLYWFDEDSELSKDSLDESSLRRLLEKTDNSIDSVRMFSETETGFLRSSMDAMEYLMDSCPKSALQVPTHISRSSSVSLVNLCALLTFQSNSGKSDFIIDSIETDSDASFPHLRLHSSASQALWEDCMRGEKNFAFENNVLPKIRSNCMQIDGSIQLGQKMQYPVFAKKTPYYKNVANPLHVSPSSVIEFSSSFGKDTLDLLVDAKNIFSRFLVDGPVWVALEADELREMSEVLSDLIGRYGDPEL